MSLVDDFWRCWDLSNGSRQQRVSLERPPDAEHERIAESPQVVYDRIARSQAEGQHLILELLEKAPDVEAECYLGAGPLEELIVAYPKSLEWAEVHAGRNPRMRRALDCVWQE